MAEYNNYGDHDMVYDGDERRDYLDDDDQFDEAEDDYSQVDDNLSNDTPLDDGYESDGVLSYDQLAAENERLRARLTGYEDQGVLDAVVRHAEELEERVTTLEAEGADMRQQLEDAKEMKGNVESPFSAMASEKRLRSKEKSLEVVKRQLGSLRAEVKRAKEGRRNPLGPREFAGVHKNTGRVQGRSNGSVHLTSLLSQT